MPAEGVSFLPHVEILRYEEIERLLHIALQLGIVNVRLTGGEPLLRKDILSFITRIRQFSELQKLGITTNGLLLAKHAAALKAAGITAINISLDTLQRQRFEQITRQNHLDAVLAGIRAAQAVGFTAIKVNAVAIRGVNDDELDDFVRFADQYDVVMRFIEYMPFSGNPWQLDGFISAEELYTRLTQRYRLEPVPAEMSATAQTYRIPGYRGQIGFIASVSHNFCAACNRLRLTADGHLRPCLHGSVEIDVKTPLRQGATDAVLTDLFRQAVAQKPRIHQDFLDQQYRKPDADRAMVKIGG